MAICAATAFLLDRHCHVSRAENFRAALLLWLTFCAGDFLLKVNPVGRPTARRHLVVAGALTADNQQADIQQASLGVVKFH